MGQIELGKIVCGKKKRNVFVLIRERAGERQRERERERQRMSFFQRLAEWEKGGCQNKNQGS